MKKRFTLIMLAAIALASCQKKELDLPVADSLPFIGTTESFDSNTKTTLEDGRVLWKRGDQLSIFAGRTLNERYQVTDESDGLTTAAFNAVSTPGFVSSVAISNNVAYYPYAERNVLAQRGNVYELSTTLPAVQQYAENSFGPGAFPMTSVTSSTSDYNLKFKNVLGGLKLQLTGDAKIASISITGNADEVLCGAASVTVEAVGVPSIELTDDTATTVTLDCGAGVQLSSTEATSFVIALPPMTFGNGFTVTVTDTDGMAMEISTDKSQTISRSSILKMPAKEYDGTRTPSVGQPSGELCFTAEKAGSTVKLNKVGNPYEVPQEYCTDGENWYPYTFGTRITLANVGDKVYFRRMTDGVADGFSKVYNETGARDCYQFAMSGLLAASGNVMSLVDRTCQSTTIPNDYCFFDLFKNCTALTQAPELPATTLARGCYYYMFAGCTALTKAPELPATTLAIRCYCGMFSGCTALTQAPELPATTLAKYCYQSMFYGCKALTQAPELPAMTLTTGCYDRMFFGCTALTQAPELPAMTLAEECYREMFWGCAALTQAPELPAMTLTSHCYYYMFYSCTALNEVRCHAIDISASRTSNATLWWLSDVSPTGTFYADPSANWSRGISGIPEGWTVKSLDGTSSQPSRELCFTAEQAGSTVTLNKDGEPYDVPQEYCTDGENWHPYTFGTRIPLANVGDKVYFRKMTDGVADGFSKSMGNGVDYYYQFAMSGRLAASGNVMSLVDRTCQSTTIPNGDCFSRLFYGCTSLTQAPELPATTLAQHCYLRMFMGCTSLTQAPELPATTLAASCYAYMFDGCTSLTQAPELPATTLAQHCYDGMFSGCKSLTQAPELPATTLADHCYLYMFENCKSLAQAPELPATKMANSCYEYMFRSCISLTQAPELPATTLAERCYSSMFSGCTSLSKAPELPATTLVEDCYERMFTSCSSLKEVRCYAVDIRANYATYNWLSGVSSTGTFYASPSASWSRGTSGIPEGWTVKTLSE